ncbi:MAG: glycoside hydrolase family 9 protein, partial [Fimbriimonadales bacterium]
QWALAHGGESGDPELGRSRLYASAALFRLTGDLRYLRAADADLRAIGQDVWLENLHGPALLALPGWKAKPPAALLNAARAAVLSVADQSLESSRRRAMRWGGNFLFPMLIGHQTTPHAMELAVAWRMLRDEDPAKAREFYAALHTTADYFLGCNPLNIAWVTGLAERHPVNVFHLDGWYNGKDTIHPGVVPYGPWRKAKDQGQGPWDYDWANQTLHPQIDLWPGAERWFEQRCSPLTCEFTIHQNLAPAAAIYGILAGRAKGSAR